MFAPQQFLAVKAIFTALVPLETLNHNMTLLQRLCSQSALHKLNFVLRLWLSMFYYIF